jgi:hypothetical protein
MPLQVIPVIQVFDYLYAGNTPLGGVPVSVTLNYSQATYSNPVTAQVPFNVTTTTDVNGYWTVSVPANSGNPPTVQPANTLYSVVYGAETGYKPFLINVSNIGVPGGGWQASSISVASTTTLNPASAVVSSLTVTSLTTGQVVFPAGGGLLSGDPGHFWDNTNKRLGVGTAVPATLLDVNGVSTFRGAMTVTAGGITVSAGGVIVTGNSTVTGTLIVTAGLTVNAGGAAITGASNVVGTFGISGALSLTGAPGVIAMQGAGQAAILGGTTGWAVNNNANNAANIATTDAGNVSVRGTLDLIAAGQFQIGPTNATTVAVRGPQKSLVVGKALTTFGAGAQTLTAANLLGGAIEHTVGAAVADTTDTGANLDTAIPNVANGDTIECYLTIIGAFTVTLTAAAGITIKGTTALLGTAAGKTAHLIFRRTAASTWTCYVVFSA